jgi:hypothetical protein
VFAIAGQVILPWFAHIFCWTRRNPLPRWLAQRRPLPLRPVGFVLLLCGLPALYARLSGGAGEAMAFRALVLSGTGVALILPTLGVELYALPAIGRIYLGGRGLTFLSTGRLHGARSLALRTSS